MNMEIKCFMGNDAESNGYLLCEKGGGVCCVVDPSGDGERFLRAAANEGLRIRGILLTHHHYDHVGGVRRIKSAASCPVYMHKDDVGPYRGAADVPLSGGERIPLGGEHILVLHTPGHTRGSVCFRSEDGLTVCTGDTIFNVDLGRTDLADGSPSAMERSVRETVSLWPDDAMIYPGHGEPCNMRFVRVYNGEYLEIMGETDRCKPWNGESFVL
jgi:glyoxylase-like metal-dependent hydrolase (beta-lactamase superfamily II)